jgi:hypothetical protein
MASETYPIRLVKNFPSQLRILYAAGYFELISRASIENTMYESIFAWFGYRAGLAVPACGGGHSDRESNYNSSPFQHPHFSELKCALVMDCTKTGHRRIGQPALNTSRLNLKKTA